MTLYFGSIGWHTQTSALPWKSAEKSGRTLALRVCMCVGHCCRAIKHAPSFGRLLLGSRRM